MDFALDERIERYLNGALSPDEAIAFERGLADPVVARGFREALLIRELMKSPVGQVPEGLSLRIEEALGLTSGASAALVRQEKEAGMVRTIWESSTWWISAPLQAMPSTGSSGAGRRGFATGMAPLNTLLAPLTRLTSRDKRQTSGGLSTRLFKRLLRRS